MTSELTDRVAPVAVVEPPARRNWARLLSPRNIGVVYVLVALCILFTIWIPELFWTAQTLRLILNSSAITAIAALAIIVPLSARVFDLSFAYVMTLTGVVVAQLLVLVKLPLVVAILLGLAVAVVVGCVNAFVVVGMKIDSFIGTLAVGSLVLATIIFVTGGSTVSGAEMSQGIGVIYSTRFLGIVLPAYLALLIAIVLWLVLEHTPVGRRLYAVGFNEEAARLGNIKVKRFRVVSLLISASIAGIAGIVIVSSTQTGSTTSGTAYLLPAFAAAFLGSTQFKGGRFNAWGTVLAVLMLQTGVVGLALAGAPQWAADTFTGVMLIAALSGASAQRRKRRSADRKPKDVSNRMNGDGQ